jgi:hypothetical protein
VGAQNDDGVFVNGTIDAGKGRPNSGIVSDLARIIKGNVKIHTDEYAFIAQVNLINRLFFEMFHTFLSLPRSMALCRGKAGYSCRDAIFL